jgi:hypothetical protein
MGFRGYKDFAPTELIASDLPCLFVQNYLRVERSLPPRKWTSLARAVRPYRPGRDLNFNRTSYT